MQRWLVLALFTGGCGDSDAPQSEPGATGTSPGVASTSGTSGSQTASGGTAAPTTSQSSTSSGGGGQPSASSGSAGPGSTSAAGLGVGFAQIQVDLENAGGAVGSYPSCIDGAACHSNPSRNVHLLAGPDAAGLQQNYQNILDAPGVPWVTPPDERAQMLHEVPIPPDVYARWLAWIESGAPFEAF